MLLKVSSIIFLTCCLITLISSQATSDNSKEPKDGVILDMPICILTNHNDTKPSQDFKDFAKYEECQFQHFMDTLYELDCYIMHRIDQEYSCTSDKCLKELFDTREGIYRQRLDIACVCETPRNITAPKNDETLFSISLNIDERPKKISTLCEYIICWKNLWITMQKAVEVELAKETNGVLPIPECVRKIKDGENVVCQDGIFGC